MELEGKIGWIRSQSSSDYGAAWAWTAQELKDLIPRLEGTPLSQFWTEETDPLGKKPGELGYQEGPWVE